MTESQQLAKIIDSFYDTYLTTIAKITNPEGVYGFKQGVFWCIEQLMARNGLTQEEALEMVGISETK